MAKKISQLTQATEVKSDDVTVIVQDGETKKLPLNMMVTKQDIENKKIAGLAKLDEIEATYENDTYTPTITVKNKSSVKTGEGDEVDYSANVMDGPAKSAILKGCTGYRDIDTGEILETFEEGRNLELVSVRMPVLTTVGKNLFDISKCKQGRTIDDNGNEVTGSTPNHYAYGEFIHINNEFFTMSIISDNGIVPNNANGTRLRFYNENKNLVDSQWFADTFKESNGRKYRTISMNGAKYLKINFSASGDSFDTTYEAMQTIQIEEGSIATPYEPFKANILTVNEEVELRGVGDVKDELNLSTGELTQRIGEIVLDGSDDEKWILTESQHGENTYLTYIRLPDAMPSQEKRLVIDKLPYLPLSSMDLWLPTTDVETYRINFNRDLLIRWNKARFSKTINSASDFKEYLQGNPITVQYALNESVIKTVDLMPSGTHPSTTPYCWKNGHIQLSGSGLLPNLEYSVVTSRAGQINQNATMIVKNDKRIFDLEILLAGGLVNTTYQALTLQNQVETGLSKVSLSSETEPDYLLYHMIMKLIEEKAYKLDDLTEKVSVFYLYEKLSDEQFETIYSALYPFVEDEIIEEPVVEELPEVVEDEVIM